MWYVILFVVGLVGGIITMSVFAAATIDRLRWKNKHLNTKLESKKRQAAREALEYQIWEKQSQYPAEEEEIQKYAAA